MKIRFLATFTFFVLHLTNSLVYSQCTNGTAYTSATAPTAGGSATMNCTWAGEYNTINGVAAATQYTATSSNATDFITIRQGTSGGALIASGTTPLNWTSTVAGTYYIHVNTNAACGTENSCRDIVLTHIIPTTNMSYVSSTTAQASTAGVENCSSDAEVLRVEVVTTGTLSPLNFTDLIIRTDNSTAALSDIGGINVYYTGTSPTFSATNLFGSGATAAPGNDISITGNQTLAEGTNYFWVSYNVNAGATIGNVIDGLCNQITVAGVNQTPSTTNPAGNRSVIDCARACPIPATIFSDDFESGAAVQGVIPGTTYGSVWTGLPHGGTYHGWLNIVNGLGNVDVFERRWDGLYEGCQTTINFWYLHNSNGFDVEYTFYDDNNNVIDHLHVITPAAQVNNYQNYSHTFTSTTPGVRFVIHVNSVGGHGMDLAWDDFSISQCCDMPTLLPVELSSFSSSCSSNGGVDLKWTTLSETNNDYFEVQRSFDGNEWEALETVTGAGNSTSQNTYLYTDNTQRDAMYRLKQVDFDGEWEYSSIIASSLKDCGTDDMTIYPNPIDETMTIQLNSDKKVDVRIYNSIGREVYSGNISNQTQISTYDWATGIYMVHIGDEVRKVIVNH